MNAGSPPTIPKMEVHAGDDAAADFDCFGNYFPGH
jgi:hypothetical protein